MRTSSANGRRRRLGPLRRRRLRRQRLGAGGRRRRPLTVDRRCRSAGRPSASLRPRAGGRGGAGRPRGRDRHRSRRGGRRRVDAGAGRRASRRSRLRAAAPVLGVRHGVLRCRRDRSRRPGHVRDRSIGCGCCVGTSSTRDGRLADGPGRAGVSWRGDPGGARSRRWPPRRVRCSARPVDAAAGRPRRRAPVDRPAAPAAARSAAVTPVTGDGASCTSMSMSAGQPADHVVAEEAGRRGEEVALAAQPRVGPLKVGRGSCRCPGR